MEQVAARVFVDVPEEFMSLFQEILCPDQGEIRLRFANDMILDFKCHIAFE